MEHWYNNQVVNGFCELLIEQSFKRKIFNVKLLEKRSNQRYFEFIKENRWKQRQIDPDEPLKIGPAPIRQQKKDKIGPWMEGIASDPKRLKSFLRLRNIFYLCILINDNKVLSAFRYHRLDRILHQESEMTKIETLKEAFVRKFNRFRMVVQGESKPKNRKTNRGGS